MLTFSIYKCYCFYSNESLIINLEARQKLESENRCDEDSVEYVNKSITDSTISASSSVTSSNVKESKDIKVASKSTTASLNSLSSSVNTSNLLSPRTNIIQLKNES
jgi:hypothetical protein